MNKKIISLIVIIFVAYLLLLIPDSTTQYQNDSDIKPFAWDLDSYWKRLQDEFEIMSTSEPDSIDAYIEKSLYQLRELSKELDLKLYEPDDTLFSMIENYLFKSATLLSVRSDRFDEFVEIFKNLRINLKRQSINWDMNNAKARDRIYRLLYGGRLALEEIILQKESDSLPVLFDGRKVVSHTPSAQILGFTIHSGDILVSRGGAPTSALIARGSDYPGNFSHVALMHVDSLTHKISIIEAHIEIGVAIADEKKYIDDKKLRIMVLRMREDHPKIIADPMLPHKAAQYILDRANSEHIQYDFAMDYNNDDKLFCSEVASSAYNKFGVKLWMGISRISTSGVKSWLSAFGVRNFITQEPSDLEYDPQLEVVAEWRDFNSLKQDRFDNAVIDVMLEGAEAGDKLEYEWYLLPFARVMKLYSWTLNKFGAIGPIPEGMDASSALRNGLFSATHKKIRDKLEELVEKFETDKGYFPPYWELIKMARISKKTI